MEDWERRNQIWEKAEKLAGSSDYITNRNNPLRELAQLDERRPQYRYNMDVLENDYAARKVPVAGKVYAGLMDNMRYGGNE